MEERSEVVVRFAEVDGEMFSLVACGTAPSVYRRTAAGLTHWIYVVKGVNRAFRPPPVYRWLLDRVTHCLSGAKEGYGTFARAAVPKPSLRV